MFSRNQSHALFTTNGDGQFDSRSMDLNHGGVKRSIIILLSLLVSLLCVTCADPLVPGEPAPCPCLEDEGCSAMACGVRVVLDESCASDMSFAEVLVGDHLEEETILPGTDMLTCAKVEPSENAVVFVRGGSWIWGPVDVACDLPGGALVTLTFQCLEGL